MVEPERVLVLNAGSSSLKASILDGDVIEPLVQVSVPAVTEAGAERGAIERLLEDLAVPRASIDAVGHRVVHGGTRLTGPVIIDDGVVAAIADLGALAPLHNPATARSIAAARAALAGVPHVASFDTAFHATLAPEAFTYGLPYEWYARWGYRRYGFHGLSAQWATERAAQLLAVPASELDLVVAHLGAGCSVTAVAAGRSVWNSMGLTPLDGLVMATRAGSVDPGLLLAAQVEHRLGASALLETLERDSGLLGISGRSADLREILAAELQDERCALAVSVFVRSAAAGIAAAASALRKVDAVVFTGGIGENAAGVRARIVDRLASLGVPPIEAAEVGADAVLGRGRTSVLRIEAREDVVVSREVRRVLAAAGPRAVR